MQSLHARTTRYNKRMPRVKCLLFLAVCLVSILSACSSGSLPSGQAELTATPSSMPGKPTPTPLPHGTVLYQADWSHDLKSWRPSRGWKVINGVLQSTTTGDLSITLPYKPTMTDYALYLRLRVYTLTAPLGSYSIAADPARGRDGYRAGVLDFPRPDKETNSIHPQMEVYTEPVNLDDPGTAHDLGIHYEWHDYHLEIHGARLTFYLDNQITGHAISQTGGFVNGPIHLEIATIGVQVSEFRVLVP